MSTVCHEFGPSLERGQKFEEKLDEYFSKEFQIFKVDMNLQRLGVDRIFVRYSDGARFTMEYKTDERTADTNNVFIETVSVDTEKKPGWAFTSVAQLIVYFIPQWHKIYLANTMVIRKRLAKWRGLYKEKPAQNDGYLTMGLCVPVDVFGAICKIVEVEHGST